MTRIKFRDRHNDVFQWRLQSGFRAILGFNLFKFLSLPYTLQKNKKIGESFGCGTLCAVIIRCLKQF